MNRKVIKNGVIVEGFTSGSTVLDIQGTQGELFSITDDLTGEIFTVSDISGMPILSVEADGNVNVDGNLFINTKQVWHAGNSNLETVDWMSKNFIAYGDLSAINDFYQYKNINVLNKAENGWITWATRNAAGSETVVDLNNIGTITTNSTISATTVNLSNLTAGYIPYQTVGGLANSGMLMDGTNVGVAGSSSYNWLIATHTGGSLDPNWGFGVSHTGEYYSPFVKFHGGDGGDVKRGFKVIDARNDSVPFFVGGNGNVGVGTTEPIVKLSVEGDNVNLLRLGQTSSTTGNRFLGLGFDVAGRYGFIGGYQYAEAWLPVCLNPSGGNVGIGTTNPKSTLHIGGPSAFLRITDDNISNKNYDTFSIAAITQNFFSMGVSSSTGFTHSLIFDGFNNRIGVGVADPTYKLDVNGTGRFSDMLYLNAGASVSNNVPITFAGGDNDNFYIGSPVGDDKLYIGMGNSVGSYSIAINEQGNVGIGTPTPSATFEVNGTANVNGSPIWYGGNFAGYGSWTPNFTSTIDCIGNGSFQKVRGGNDWDAQIYSSEGYLTNVFAQASDMGNGGSQMFGLNSDPLNNSSYNTIDYAIYFAGGSLQAYESGTGHDLSTTYNDTDVLTIHYDGVNVRYYKNNTLLRSVARSVGDKLYFDSSIHTLTSGFKNVGFGSMGPLITNSVRSFTSDIVNINVPPTTGGTDLLLATMADNDFFRLRVGGTSDNGYVELATADAGVEPIYVRQYSGYFTSPLRTLTLLDGNGDTTIPGKLDTGSNIYVGGGNVDVAAGNNRVKYGMWGVGDGSYGIGMGADYLYGGLADYAITTQISADPGRGFWWGNTSHGNSQGAMALTHDGLLTVAKGIRMGYGNNDTVTPSENVLDVYGNVDITGTLTAAVKSFVIDHPTKQGKKLQYGVVEGPEHSVYTRGMLDGDDTIILPEEWVNLVHEDGITVTLTPIGKSQKLYVKSVNSSKIKIGHGFRKIKCYYTVFAERKDVGKLITEFEKK